MIKPGHTSLTLPRFARLLLDGRRKAGIHALLFIAISFNLCLLLPVLFHAPLGAHLLAVVQGSCFLFLGILNTWLFTRASFRKIFYLPGSGTAYFSLLFLLIAVLPGTYYYFAPGNAFGLAAGSSAAFLLPSLVYQSWREYRQIPEKIFPAWHLPELSSGPPVYGIPGSVHLQVQLVISRGASDAEPGMYPVTAAGKMRLGRVFEYFIRQQLAGGQSTAIEFTPGQQTAWTFRERCWKGLFFRRLNPLASLSDNALRNGAVIVVSRG